jgi:error-prone DNA polymerase
MVAEHETMGLTVGPHPMALMRPGLPEHVLTLHDLHTAADGTTVTHAGIVIARQRPGTAKGIVFMLVEDEHGMVNVIVPPPVHRRDRLAVNAEPLVSITGKLERRGAALNLIATRVEPLVRPDLTPVPADAPVPAGRAADAEPAVVGGAGLRDLRAAAPRANSFGRGHR